MLSTSYRGPPLSALYLAVGPRWNFVLDPATRWHFCSNCPRWPRGTYNVIVLARFTAYFEICEECIARHERDEVSRLTHLINPTGALLDSRFRLRCLVTPIRIKRICLDKIFHGPVWTLVNEVPLGGNYDLISTVQDYPTGLLVYSRSVGEINYSVRPDALT